MTGVQTCALPISKTHIPQYSDLDERRYFAPAQDLKTIPAGVFGLETLPFGTKILFTDTNNTEISFAIEIGEDLWAQIPPSCEHVNEGALIIANLSARNILIGKEVHCKNLIIAQSGRGTSAYIYANAGSGESTTDLVFAGQNIIAENGKILNESRSFTTGLLCTDVDIQRLQGERRKCNSFLGTEKHLHISLPLVNEIGRAHV